MKHSHNTFGSYGQVQAIIDRAIIKASLMGILDDTVNKKTKKAKNKRWP